MGWTADHVPDQADRVSVITGANSGIGYETTKALADHGGTVIMACRNEHRANRARESIHESVQGADLRIELVDLASLDSIADFGARLAEQEVTIDLLINNAGIGGIPRRETVDGFEYQFGVNHLGHFALTGHVLDLFSEGARVVTVSSEIHRRGRIDFDDLHSERSYGRWSAYAQSKLANLLFAAELDRRFDASNRQLISVGAHPGFVKTNFQARSSQDSFIRLFAMRIATAMFAKSPEAGARPVLYAATAPEIPRRSYVGPGGFRNQRGPPSVQEPSSIADDPLIARRLWEISREATGVRYTIEAREAGTADQEIEQ